MARKRMIDPSFWVDEKLGTVEPRGRLLFMGLISQADDEGRLNGHPALLRSLIFAYDHDITVVDIEGWLILLAERKLILRYEVDSQKYIFIANFKKHQTINRPQKSKLPEPFSECSVNGSGVVNDESMEDHAQKKLKEGNLKEEKLKEEKGREDTATDVDYQKDSILSLINELKYEGYTLHDLDEIYSFIGVVDIEVIEAALKKSTGKHSPVKYSVSALKGMLKEGVTKKEYLFQKPEAGQPPNVTPIRGRSGKPHIGIVASQPSETLTPEEEAEIRALARKLDGAR